MAIPLKIKIKIKIKVKIKKVKNTWLPAYDTHFEGVMDVEGNYQKTQFDAALKYVKERKLFIDVGAHVGTWTRMALRAGFESFQCFEPCEDNFSCLNLNLIEFLEETSTICSNVRRCTINQFEKGYIHQLGLGDDLAESHISTDKKSNSGAKSISSEGGELISVDTMDTFFLLYVKKLLGEVSLIKIDVQGSEHLVVKGGEKIIKAYKPIIIIEQMMNGKWDLRAVEILKSYGMKVLEIIGKEYIMGW